MNTFEVNLIPIRGEQSDRHRDELTNVGLHDIGLYIDPYLI